MADELEKPDAAAVADPVAMGLAMHRASPLVDAELVGYLRDQRHHLHEQLKQLRLGIWEKWLGVFLRAATAVVGVAVAGALVLMVWDAARSNGLRVEPFSVPPDLAERGLTGEVVAAKLLDRLVILQDQTNSGRPARSYANSWGEHGIKLEIPETGISLSELDNWLRQKLGHDIRVNGEIVHNDDSLSLTARAGDSGSATVSGAPRDVDMLVGRLAEAVYRATQPFRYGMYLAGKNRGAEALPVFRELALHGDHEDSLWAYNRWAVAVGNRDGIDAGLRLLDQAIATDPEAIGAYDNRGGYLTDKGWPEQALQNFRTQMTVLLDGRQTYVPASRIPVFRRVVQARLDSLTGAFREAEPVYLETNRTGYPGYNAANIRTPLIINQIGAHELTAARAMLVEMETLLPPPPGAPRGGQAVIRDMMINLAGENWEGVLALEGQAVQVVRGSGYGRSIQKTALDPMLAVAEAGLGRFPAAEKRIAQTPADCQPCLRARAQIAQMQGQQGRADFWFARAVAAAPSIPVAYAEWGNALLARGQPDAAIGKFKQANEKSPHFADALEGWGEALMAQKNLDLALAKFAEADKYAPNWGRLHLKWGEALVHAGKPGEAEKQFGAAAGLDLAAVDKAELAHARSAAHG